MFKNRWIKWGTVAVFIGVAVYSLTMNQQTFEEKIAGERAEYKRNMLAMENSPVAKLPDFKDFEYFTPDERFSVMADFEEGIAAEKFVLTMTDGSTEEMAMAGTATFEMMGKKYSLALFDEGETFLLPFYDQTNQSETYRGGRYLNVVKSNTNRLALDFNQAHNFYCVYSPRFVCPVPPKQNTMALPVKVVRESADSKLNRSFGDGDIL